MDLSSRNVRGHGDERSDLLGRRSAAAAAAVVAAKELNFVVCPGCAVQLPYCCLGSGFGPCVFGMLYLRSDSQMAGKIVDGKSSQPHSPLPCQVNIATRFLTLHLRPTAAGREEKILVVHCNSTADPARMPCIKRDTSPPILPSSTDETYARD